MSTTASSGYWCALTILLETPAEQVQPGALFHTERLRTFIKIARACQQVSNQEVGMEAIADIQRSSRSLESGL